MSREKEKKKKTEKQVFPLKDVQYSPFCTVWRDKPKLLGEAS